MKLLNIDYDNITVRSALDKMFDALNKGQRINVFFLNADCLYKAQKDAEYAAVLRQTDLLLPDGIGLKLATRLFNGRMKEDCNGTDLSPLVMQQACCQGLKIFLLGGKPGIAGQAAERVKLMFPGINIVGTASGYFGNDSQVIEEVNSSRADILFVAMGVPLQEKWIIQNRAQLGPGLCLGVGALLDYLSGAIPRAPRAVRRLHLEWLWRVCIDPRRLFKRYIVDGFVFMAYCLTLKLKSILALESTKKEMIP